MEKYVGLFLSCAAVAVLGHGTAVAADDGKRGPIFAITEENDFFFNPSDHQDRHYTQGLRVTYLGADGDMPGWMARAGEALPQIGILPDSSRLGFTFGQNIYTPTDLAATDPIPTDRPYGGWLYLGVILQRQGVIGPSGIPVLENFEMDLGVTGRPSLAEAVQENFHRWFFYPDIPRGWDNQLDTEPGLLLKYQRLWRLSIDDRSARYFDVIPHCGGELGNIAIFANLGLTLRAGYDLPDDFGIPINDSPATVSGGMTPATRPFGCYVFGGVDGRAVAHNLFLDGNSFRNGPSVDRVPFVGDLICGVAFQITRHVQASYTVVIRSHEFEGQDHADRFGSIMLNARFAF